MTAGACRVPVDSDVAVMLGVLDFVKAVNFQKFDLFQAESFCKLCLCVRFDDELLRIVLISGLFEAPMFKAFGANCWYTIGCLKNYVGKC